jgi:hypothetical protein
VANFATSSSSVVDTGVNETGSKFPAVLREFSKKFETALMVYSGAWGKLIHEKNQKSKILWHCPLKVHKNENFFGFDFEF